MKGPRHTSWLLLLFMAVPTCMDSIEDQDSNTEDQDSNTVVESRLIVSLGEDQQVASEQLVRIEAVVQNAEDGGLYYRWVYSLVENDEAGLGSAAAGDYIKNWHAISFQPQDLFPDEALAGRTIEIAAHVVEYDDMGIREGTGFKRLFIPEEQR